MSSIHLVSCGDDIRFWQDNPDQPVCRYQATKGPVDSIDWSDNGFQLIACGQQSQPLQLVTISRDTKQPPSISTTSVIQLPGSATSATFNHGSGDKNIFACAYDGGKIGLVNAQSLEVVKTLSTGNDPKRSIMSLSFDRAGTRLAASDDAGNIHVQNTIQAVQGKPLPQKDDAIVRHVKFSMLHKGLLVSGADSGCVTLWDVFKSTKIYDFQKAHSMPVSGLAFSPINDSLLLSAGLDKQFCCLDVKKNQVVKTIHTDAPLSSLDFHYEGWAVAAGTTRGRMLIYDLRQPSRPLHDVAAHNGSVQSVKFASKVSQLTSKHVKLQMDSLVTDSPVNTTKLAKPSKNSTAISPLCPTDNITNQQNRSVAPIGTSSPDRLASFYMKHHQQDTAVKTSDNSTTELFQKTRLLQAQRMLNNASVLGDHNNPMNDVENMYRSQSVDIMSVVRKQQVSSSLSVRSQQPINDDSFKSATDVRNLSPITTTATVRHGRLEQHQFSVPVAESQQLRPLPSMASTPFHMLANHQPKSHVLNSTTISTLPSVIHDGLRSESATATLIQHRVTAVDNWSPSPEPNDTLKEPVQQRDFGCQTNLVEGVGDVKEIDCQTDDSMFDDVVKEKNDENFNSLQYRLDLLEEQQSRSRIFACEQNFTLMDALRREMSPNDKLIKENEALKLELEQLRSQLQFFDAKMFNTSLRLHATDNDSYRSGSGSGGGGVGGTLRPFTSSSFVVDQR